MKAAIINIENLRLRTIIGFNDWERKKKQDVIINVEMKVDVAEAVQKDSIDNSVDYKIISKRIIAEVEQSNYFLLESLAYFILNIVLNERKIIHAKVRVDKPHAIRYAGSIAVTVSSTE